MVLNLTKYGGKAVNMTVKAVDMVGYESPETCIGMFNVPEGEWYPIQLYKGWNLVSLPIVPANSSIENVLSLLLKEGLLESVWTYDAETKTWYSYASGAPSDLKTMVDGKGYYIKMKDNDVLIISGTEMRLSGPPPCYKLAKGWNLIGFTSTQIRTLSEYLASIDNTGFYHFIFTWDTSQQGWKMIDMQKGVLKPGQAFWICMYEEAVLIPPP